MPVVASFDWPNRRIYMAAASWHPVDVYREMRADRRANEDSRKYDPMVAYFGYVAKGGGKFTSRYMLLLAGAKIVPVDGGVSPITTITGEILTDDQTAIIDTSPLTVWPQIDYQPPDTEIIVLTNTPVSPDVNVISVNAVPVTSPNDFKADIAPLL